MRRNSEKRQNNIKYNSPTILKRKKCNWDFYNILLPLWREILTIWRNLWWLHPPLQGCRNRETGGNSQILADQSTLSITRGSDYAHQIITCPPPGFSDLPTALPGLALYHCCTAYYYREQPLYSLRYEHSMGAWQMFRHIFRTISTLYYYPTAFLKFFNALLF